MGAIIGAHVEMRSMGVISEFQLELDTNSIPNSGIGHVQGQGLQLFTSRAYANSRVLFNE
jgi:hypothetical protein